MWGGKISVKDYPQGRMTNGGEWEEAQLRCTRAAQRGLLDSAGCSGAKPGAANAQRTQQFHILGWMISFGFGAVSPWAGRQGSLSSPLWLPLEKCLLRETCAHKQELQIHQDAKCESFSLCTRCAYCDMEKWSTAVFRYQFGGRGLEHFKLMQCQWPVTQHCQIVSKS